MSTYDVRAHALTAMIATGRKRRLRLIPHAGIATNSFNADKWISPAPNPGDVVLFPSYLMHAVPINPGERRISLAFNAIPTHLDSWGYRVSFSG